MSPSQEKNKKYDDIQLVSEIIANSMYWQEIYRRKSVKFEANFKHIINFTEVHIINLSL